MKIFRPLFLGLWLGLLGLSARAATLPELFTARLQCVVAVEFFVQSEIERQPVTIMGTVVDDRGTIVLPPGSIMPSVPAEQLKDFKIYRANSAEPFEGEYLGQDALTGWHFVRAEEKLRTQLVPVTKFARANVEPGLSDELWGIGLRNRDEDFLPYFLSGRVAVVMKLPQKTAVLAQDVAGPGLPVFTTSGDFAGLAQPSFGQNFLMFSRSHPGTPVLLVNVEESSVVLLPDEVLPYFQRIPQSLNGRPIAWIGVYGVQPMDREVAKLLKLEQQSGVVLSDIAVDSPAAKAGLLERDIVVAIDGQPLPRFKPDHVVVNYFGRAILERSPGQSLRLSVVRGRERSEIDVTLADEPKLPREANRRYFERLGLTVREFVHVDAVVHRAGAGDLRGVVTQFVKPGGPAATAGLNVDDRILEIDGVEIPSYGDGLAKLEAIERDRSRPEFVLLVSRAGETSVLRIKLN